MTLISLVKKLELAHHYVEIIELHTDQSTPQSVTK